MNRGHDATDMRVKHADRRTRGGRELDPHKCESPLYHGILVSPSPSMRPAHAGLGEQWDVGRAAGAVRAWSL